MLAVLTTGSLGKHFLQQFEMYPTMNQTTQVGDIQFKCQYQAGLNFYDLQPLALAKAYYAVPTPDLTNRTLYISFCNDLPETLWCTSDKSTMATLWEDEAHGGGCVQLSGGDPTKDASFSVLNESINDGLRITYNGGDPDY